jgi:hypothetical protein
VSLIAETLTLAAWRRMRRTDPDPDPARGSGDTLTLRALPNGSILLACRKSFTISEHGFAMVYRRLRPNPIAPLQARAKVSSTLPILLSQAATFETLSGA